MLRCLCCLVVMCFSSLGFSQVVIIYDTTWGGPVSGDGMKIHKSEGKLVNGLKTGVWKYWYPSGQLKSSGVYVPYTDSLITFTNEDGWDFDTTSSRNSFVNYLSLRSGKWDFYYKSGQLMQSGNYVPFENIVITAIMDPDTYELVLMYTEPDGSKHGWWTRYGENGEVESKERFDMGEFMEDDE